MSGDVESDSLIQNKVLKGDGKTMMNYYGMLLSGLELGVGAGKGGEKSRGRTEGRRGGEERVNK